MKRALLMLAAWLCAALPAYAVPAYVGSSTVTLNSGSTCSPTYTSTTGNTLFFIVWEDVSATRSYTVADGASTWTAIGSPVIDYTGANSRTIVVHRAFSVTGSSAIVSTQNATAQAYSCQVVEFSGGVSSVPSTDQMDNNPASGTQYGGATGLTVSSGTVLLSIGNVSTGGGALTAGTTGGGTAYTKLTGADVSHFAQYAITTGGETNERGSWTQAASTRQSTGVILAGTAAGGGGSHKSGLLKGRK